MGGSDGCFTAALGVATLDAMGPLCHDICGETERIEVSSLVPRTLLIAGIAVRLAWNPGEPRRPTATSQGQPILGRSSMLRAVRAVLMTVVLVIPAAAVAQNYAIPSASRDFRVESETTTGRRGPILSGYVYNDQGLTADRVQLLVEGLDASGNVTSTTTAFVIGDVPPGSRRYFEVPLTASRAPSYRVKVVTYELTGRGGV